MSDGAEEMTFEEMQRRLRDHVQPFHTSLIGISSLDEHQYMGGGTLVMVSDVPGVLTADHVWQDILDDKYPLAALAGTRAFTSPGMPTHLCRVHRLSPPTPDDEFGPDLAFFELPTDYAVGLGESGKRFFNLTGSRRHAMNLPLTAPGDSRLIFGIPRDTTSTFPDETGDGPVTRMRVETHAFASRIVDVYERGGYDYADFSLEDKQTEDFPDYVLRGMSGSGMWRVRDEPTRGRMVTDLKAVILDGVVLGHCLKSPAFLRCHGRQSIYRFHDTMRLEPR